MLKKTFVIGIGFILLLTIISPIVFSFESVDTNSDVYIDQYDYSKPFKGNTSQESINEQLYYNYPKYRMSLERTYERMKPNTRTAFEKERSISDQYNSLIFKNNGEYTPHDPIIIFGDDDFTEENGVTSGNGTANDPYIIEGWEIDTNSYAAIRISETTMNFVIRSCLLKNATIGIQLWDVPVGSVTDCHILLTTQGLRLILSSNIVIDNNTLYDNQYNLEIMGLEINHYYHDIYTSNTVDGRPIYYLLDESSLVFDENDDIGYLGLVGCDNILASGLTISNSGDGVLLVDTSNSIIASSTFSNCYQ